MAKAPRLSTDRSSSSSKHGSVRQTKSNELSLQIPVDISNSASDLLRVVIRRWWTTRASPFAGTRTTISRSIIERPTQRALGSVVGIDIRIPTTVETTSIHHRQPRRPARMPRGRPIIVTSSHSFSMKLNGELLTSGTNRWESQLLSDGDGWFFGQSRFFGLHSRVTHTYRTRKSCLFKPCFRSRGQDVQCDREC